MKRKAIQVKKFLGLNEDCDIKNSSFFGRRIGKLYSFYCFFNGHADIFHCCEDLAKPINDLLEFRMQEIIMTDGYTFACLNKTMHELRFNNKNTFELYQKFTISITSDHAADKANEKILNEWKIKNPIRLDPEIEYLETFLALD